MIRYLLALLFCVGSLSAQEIETQMLVSGLNSPVDIQNANDGSDRLFIVEQPGRIRVVRDGQLANEPFLNIQGRVQTGSERGLLGLAFPRGFAQSQRFYVNYTRADGDTVISMFNVTNDPDIADPNSEVILLTIEQPFSNHNGGQLQFGPGGLLFISTGDGGSGGDPFNSAQDLTTLLGKLLRVDVESSPGTLKIPNDNPFVDTPGARGEIWAYGLRNPWRFSFDSGSSDLWVADVGQSEFEEVNRRNSGSGGDNYGWRRMEGSVCYDPDCEPSGLILPVQTYNHSQGCSVTGGYVYRGNKFDGLRGTYIYGDFCSGLIWGLQSQGGEVENRLLLDTFFAITTFGVDEDGEIYVADRNTGTIYRIVGTIRPKFSSSGVVNAASFEQGLTPGSLTTIFVSGIRDTDGITRASAIPLPLNLDDVSVTMDGAAAPIHAIANVNGVEQVNVHAPWALLNESAASVIVSRGNTISDSVAVEVIGVQPAVFIGDGDRPAIVRNTDFTVVGTENPLTPGEYAAAYMTGLGPVANQPPTGRAATAPASTVLASVAATLNGEPVEVIFAGLAPGFVGVYQVNFRVPPTAQPGTLALVFTVDGVASPAVLLHVSVE